ncbi:MAG: ferrous iron transport protein B [Planctomycetota bacterium]
MNSAGTTGGAAARLRVALAGNPNSGKTTLFNRLTGSRAKVANYAGATVEIEIARWDLPGLGPVELVDVPGALSLSAHSLEERVAIEAIAGLPPTPRPDAVVVLADATELARHLYLVLQVRELGLPMVVALTMVDRLPGLGLRVDADGVAAALGVPVGPTPSAARGARETRARRVAEVARSEAPVDRPDLVVEPPATRADIDAVAAVVPDAWSLGTPCRARALARWALLSTDEPEFKSGLPPRLLEAADGRRRPALGEGRDLDHEIVSARYGWIDRHIDRFSGRGATPGRRTWTDRIDAVLLHPLFGFALFVGLMTVMFQSLFVVADPIVGAIEAALDQASAWVTGLGLSEGIEQFLTEAVIGGVGSVLVFLPQILLIFLFIGILEDSGYMARVVFLMDRVMKAVGLHGRAFVPMMSGFACAVPAILATRTMERRRDRLLTMMVVPLMACSARVPVYSLMIAVLYPVTTESTIEQGLLMAAMYAFSVLVALGAAAVLGRTVLRGKHAPLLLQMPPYRRPKARPTWRMLKTRTGTFLREAGTIILLGATLMWALLTFPRTTAEAAGAFEARRVDILATATAEGRDAAWTDDQLRLVDQQRAALQIRESYAGQLGRALEPLFAPLGFDWRIAIGVIGAFSAREVFVSTLSVVVGVEDVGADDPAPLRQEIRRLRRVDGSPLFTPLTCLSLMVFFALACQCLSTLAVVHREAGGIGWTVFLFGYMTALAWLCSFAVYQGGQLLGFR